MICRICIVLAIAGSSLPASAGGKSVPAGVRAHLRPRSYFVPIGTPIWVSISLENTTNQPVTLTVPETEPDLPLPEMGLPLSHVFSGPNASGISLTTPASRRWDKPVGFRPPHAAPILMLAARSTVGTAIDLREYFPALRSPGEFRITWSPYGGGVTSDTVVINVTPLKQAEIQTDEGMMTIRFWYEDAPHTVANFIELAEAGFYDGKTFHRIEPGYLIQGGCPRMDGTGIRLDGVRIEAEFNGHPHEKGSVSMALLDDDPDSASCQFFICNTRQKDWDGKYTVFGHLVGAESYATLDRLMATPVDDLSRPLRTLYVRRIRMLQAPPKSLSDSP